MRAEFVNEVIDHIKNLYLEVEEVKEDLNDLFKDKTSLNKYFSGKDKDTLRVIKSSLETLYKKESAVDKLNMCTNVPLKEKCISLLQKNGYKLFMEPDVYALPYHKAVKKVYITFLLETFDLDDEFKGTLGLEINVNNGDTTFYNLKTEDLPEVLKKIETVFKKKDFTPYDLFNKLSAMNNHIEEADETFFNYDEKSHKYTLKKLN